MTRQEVYDYIVAQLAVPVNSITKVLNSFSKVLDFVSESTVDEVIPDWTNALTFQTDGSDAGEYTVYPDDNGKKRIFQTKVDDNINHEPPTDPDVTEDTFWLEISQSAGSAIKEWTAGIYGTGLIIVYHDHSEDGPGLYKLVDPVRPYESTDIEAEITAGDWEQIAVNKAYVDAAVVASVIHKRVATGTVGAATEVDISITWDTPFPDTNYSVVVSMEYTGAVNFTSFRADHVRSITTTGIVVRVINTSGAGKDGNIHAIAIHD